MEVVIVEALRLLDASKEIVPLMVVFLVMQTQSIKGRLIRVETILEK